MCVEAFAWADERTDQEPSETLCGPWVGGTADMLCLPPPLSAQDVQACVALCAGEHRHGVA